jgi:exosortase
MQLIGILGAGLFVESVAFVISIIGAILWIGGFAWLRAWALPLILALFMLPKLAVVYNQATLPLQLLASRLAAGMLTMTGVGVIRSGNILDVGGHQVAVAQACSGIRYLLPLGFMAVVFAYIADSRPWMRVALLAAAVPIAIAANALRVAFSAYSPKLAGGTLHDLMGVAIFVLCLGTLIPVRNICSTISGASHG